MIADISLHDYGHDFYSLTSLEQVVCQGNNLYNVTLKVYDLLGKELLTILNTKLTCGNYSIRLDALDFNSGIYFYKLTVEEFSEIRKMILIK